MKRTHFTDQNIASPCGGRDASRIHMPQAGGLRNHLLLPEEQFGGVPSKVSQLNRPLTDLRLQTSH
jgi:hypothetical protein